MDANPTTKLKFLRCRLALLQPLARRAPRKALRVVTSHLPPSSSGTSLAKAPPF